MPRASAHFEGERVIDCSTAPGGAGIVWPPIVTSLTLPDRGDGSLPEGGGPGVKGGVGGPGVKDGVGVAEPLPPITELEASTRPAATASAATRKPQIFSTLPPYTRRLYPTPRDV